MKQSSILLVLPVLAIVLLASCGRSEKEKKELGELALEVSQLHSDLAKKLTELGKVASQPDSVLARQNAWLIIHPKMRSQVRNDDLDSAKQKISSAFDALNGWETLPSATFEQQMKKLTHDLSLIHI